MSSNNAIVELSRSKARYKDQYALLRGYVGKDGSTAKEVAVEALNWMYDDYADCPKRAYDLFKLGYLELLENRKCRRTGKVSHTYRITGKGLDKIGKSRHVLAPTDATDRSKQVSNRTADGKSVLGGLKLMLEG